MIFYIGIISILAVICLNDFLFFRIENAVNLSLVALFVVGWTLGYMNVNLLLSVSVACLLFFCSAIMNHYNLIGGGDVKLLFAIGLFIANNMFIFLCSLSIFSLLIATCYMLFGKTIDKHRIKWVKALYKSKLRSSYVGKIFLPSLANISYQEIKQSKTNNGKFTQEIPYGVILGLSALTAISVEIFNMGVST